MPLSRRTTTKNGKKRTVLNERNTGSCKAQKQTGRSSAGSQTRKQEERRMRNRVQVEEEEEDSDMDGKQRLSADPSSSSSSSSSNEVDSELDDSDQDSNDKNVTSNKRLSADPSSSSNEVDSDDKNVTNSTDSGIENEQKDVVIDSFQTGMLDNLTRMSTRLVVGFKESLLTIYAVWVVVHLHFLQVLAQLSLDSKLMMDQRSSRLIFSYQLNIVKFSYIFTVCVFEISSSDFEKNILFI